VKTVRSLRLFFIVLACTIFVFLVQYGVNIAIMKLFDTTDNFKEGTKVGTIEIGGKVKEQAEEELSKKVAAWTTKSRISLVYQDVVIPIPASLFTFDVVDSIQHIKNGEYTPLDVAIKKEDLRMLLADKLNEELATKINMKNLEKELSHAASSFATSVNIPVITLLDRESEKKIVAQGKISNISKYKDGLEKWDASYGSLIVPAKSEISINQLVKEKNIEIDDESLSVLATLMYKTVLPTNFQIRQRSTSLDLPSYAELGEEARAEKDTADFVFYNPNETSYTLTFEISDNEARLLVKGLPFVYSYVVNRNEVTKIPKELVVQSVMPNGQKHDAVTDQRAGKDGYVVKVYREQYKLDGSFIKREKVAEDYYLPTSQVKWALVQPKTQPAVSPSSVQPSAQTQNQSGGEQALPATGSTSSQETKPENAVTAR
jgi:DNA-directed RNA polymerase subunit H (RpoH/RPB5)/predicted house-cleaning noncanonical NTP pyrophosphatase (MazG superfamily)